MPRRVGPGELRRVGQPWRERDTLWRRTPDQPVRPVLSRTRDHPRNFDDAQGDAADANVLHSRAPF